MNLEEQIKETLKGVKLSSYRATLCRSGWLKRAAANGSALTLS